MVVAVGALGKKTLLGVVFLWALRRITQTEGALLLVGYVVFILLVVMSKA